MKNKGTWIIVGIVAAFVLLIAGIFVSTNNRAVSLEEQVFTADSDIQAQEKRRTDLIYNLADCVKEYDKHEAETLLNVVEARGNNGSTTDIENVTTSIAAVAEAYPELKSNENYKEMIVMQCPISAVMSEIIIIQADDVDAAAEDLKARQQKAIDQDAWYPDDIDMANNSIVGTCGDYAYFIIGSEAETAEKIINDYVTNNG